MHCFLYSTCYTPCQFHTSWIHNHNIWRSKQSTKLLIIQLSPSWFCFFFFWGPSVLLITLFSYLYILTWMYRRQINHTYIGTDNWIALNYFNFDAEFNLENKFQLLFYISMATYDFHFSVSLNCREMAGHITLVLLPNWMAVNNWKLEVFINEISRSWHWKFTIDFREKSFNRPSSLCSV
jgi:hypothetical protein